MMPLSAVNEIEEGHYYVKSERKDNSYMVDRPVGKTPPCCSIVCRQWAICVHQFSCTCMDHLIWTTVCKHSHLTVAFLKSKHQIESDVKTLELQSISNTFEKPLSSTGENQEKEEDHESHKNRVSYDALVNSLGSSMKEDKQTGVKQKCGKTY
jgi:hypothetical protein